MTDRAALALQQEKLAHRLEDGYRRIEQAVAEGKDVAAWEAFWLTLLRDYEAISDELAARGGGQ